MLECRQIDVLEGKCRRFRILPNDQRLTPPRIIDQFGRKRCQKKRNDVLNLQRQNSSCYEAKKQADLRSNVPLHDQILKSIWPQKVVLQACYGRKFHLESTLEPLYQDKSLEKRDVEWPSSLGHFWHASVTNQGQTDRNTNSFFFSCLISFR